MESGNFVLACNKVESMQQKKLTRIEVPNFTCTVDQLAKVVGNSLNLEKDNFDIICFGKTLECSSSLESYGINNGIIIYLLKKKEPAFKEPHAPSQDISPDGNLSHRVQEMCIALKSALLNPLFRKVLEGFSDSEKRENLIAVNPELRADPTLFGILSDPELLNQYTNRNNIKSVLKRYPNFLEVATHISATFHEESSSGNSLNLENLDRSAFLNYSIDAPSDDEMDDSDASSVSSTNTQASSSRLTEHPNQSFSNMLMRAYQNRNQASHSSRQHNQSSSSSTLASTSPVITQDMLRQALQSSSGPVAQPTPPQPPAAPVVQPVAQATVQAAQPTQPQPAAAPEQRTTAQILIGWAPQLNQMRELGITDQIVAIQALEATNGDVQAAINIIFSDFN